TSPSLPTSVAGTLRVRTSSPWPRSPTGRQRRRRSSRIGASWSRASKPSSWCAHPVTGIPSPCLLRLHLFVEPAIPESTRPVRLAGGTSKLAHDDVDVLARHIDDL